VDDGAGAAVEQGAEVVEGPGHVDVGDVHMPVLVRGQRLDKARAGLLLSKTCANVCAASAGGSGKFVKGFP
jgi:hypothetical protein